MKKYCINITLILACFVVCLNVSNTSARESAGEIEKLIGIYAITAAIQEYGGIEEDTSINDYVDSIWRPLKRTALRDGAMEIVVLDSSEVNALAVPGGFFGITKGLLKYIKNDDELACIIGHELGHFENKHGLSSLKIQMGFMLGLKVLDIWSGKAENNEDQQRREAIKNSAKIIAMLVELKFSRNQEYEADKYGFYHSVKAGFNPYGCLDFFNRSNDDVNILEVWVSTHPSDRQRLNKLRSIMGEYGYDEDTHHRTDSRPARLALSYRGLEGKPRTQLSPAQMNTVMKAVDTVNGFIDETEKLTDEEALDLFYKRNAM